MHYVSAQFDRIRNIDSYLPQDVWRECNRCLTRVVTALDSERGIKLGALKTDDIAATAILQKSLPKIKEETKVEAKPDDGGEDGEEKKTDEPASTTAKPAAAEVDDTQLDLDADGVLHVPGDLGAYVSRLEEQYTKALQKIDPQTYEYVNRLEDEAMFLELAFGTQLYYERQDDHKEASRMALLRMEHTYYKHDRIANALNKAQTLKKTFGDRSFFHPACTYGSKPNANVDVATSHPGAASGYPTLDVEDLNVSKELVNLSTYIIKVGDPRSTHRAVLCHVFHHAIHDRFYEARDMLLMSHIGDTISKTDVATQILYNRTLAQVGLCAFRAGLLKECRSCLGEVCKGGRVKELLAQGIAWKNRRYEEKDPAQENLEKRRLVPYHQHINLELIECCHLTSAMLLEMPYKASPTLQARRDRVDINYYSTIDRIERNGFNGPPESTKEFVHAASKALRVGSWEECANYIFGMKRVWRLITNSEQVKARLLDLIKEVGLRVYLLTYSTHYDSISQTALCNVFQMSENKVHAIVSKMMVTRELSAKWDQLTKTIVLHQTEPTKLQTLAEQFAGRIEQFVNLNDDMLQSRNIGTSGDGDDNNNINNRNNNNRRNNNYNNRRNNNYNNRRSSGRGRGRGRGRGGGGRGRWGRNNSQNRFN